jgi:hypothetical protein
MARWNHERARDRLKVLAHTPGFPSVPRRRREKRPDAGVLVALEVRDAAALVRLAERLGEIAADMWLDSEAEFLLTAGNVREIVSK